jgi:hypothetical protein
MRRCREAGLTVISTPQHTPLADLLNIWSTGCMHTVLTAKLKLHTTPDQFRALRQT